jgi:hypothetical protein
MRVTRFLKILRRPTAGNASNGGGDDSYRKNGTLSPIADAVDNAPQGRVIRDSEEKARDALDRFRRVAYFDCIRP